MSSPTANPFPHEANNAGPISFPFSVTWDCVSKGVTMEGFRRPADARTPVVFTASTPAAGIASVAQLGSGDARSSSSTQWEMVIPKMTRPGRRPEPRGLAKPSAVPSAPVAKVLATWQLALIASVSGGLIFAAAIGLVRGTRSQRSVMALPPPSVAEASWVRERAPFFPDASAFQHERRLVLYRASQDQSDYRLQFDWVPDSKGVGWVFRVRDPRNYYAARIRLAQPGTPLAFIVERFAVVAGRESAHSSKTGSFTGNDRVIRIGMDASGPAFALNVQGKRVASWTDSRLPSGGLGFFEELNEQPAVQSVQLSFSTPGGDFQGSLKDGVLP